MMILVEDSGFKIKVEVLLVLIIFVYECISLEFIEILGIMFEEWCLRLYCLIYDF